MRIYRLVIETLGFVEYLTEKPTLFEETASREGLIENEALSELKDFLFKSLKKQG